MRKYLYGIGMAVLMAAFTSCSNTPSSAGLLPDDAVVVVRMDVKQIAEKSALSDNQEIKEQIKTWLKDADLKKRTSDKILSIIDDPAEMGLDLRDPLFLAVPADEEQTRLVGSVYDSEKLTDFLDIMAKEGDLDKVDTYDDLSGMALGSNLAIVFDDKCFMVVGKDYDDDFKDVAKDVLDVFSGKAKSDLLEDKDFAEMCSRDGVMQLLFRGEGLDKIRDFKEISKSFPDGCEMEDIAYLLDIEANLGELVMKCEYLANSKEWKEWIANTASSMGEIKGEFTDLVSRKYAAVFGNFDGELLLKSIDEMDLMDDLDKDERRIFENMLTAIKGDFALGFNQVDMVDDDNQFVFYAQSKNNDLVDALKDINSNGELEELGKNAYSWKETSPWGVDSVEESSLRMLFGIKNGNTYCCTSTNDEPKTFDKPRGAFDKSDIKGKGLYGFLNFAQFDYFGYYSEVYEVLAKYLDFAEVYIEEDGCSVMRVAIKNKNKNPLEIIYSMTADIIGAFDEWLYLDENYAEEPAPVDDEDDYAVEAAPVDDHDLY